MISTSERAAFLAAIIADPADDVRRLAFADYCDENGERASELYRRAMRAAELPRKIRELIERNSSTRRLRKRGDECW